MGDINFDLTKNKRFLFIPYTLAAAGAAAGVATVIATAAVLPAVPVLAAAGAFGAVAGGIAFPSALTAAAGVFGFMASRQVTELKVIPLGVAVVGGSCAKAMFVTPFQAAYKGIRSVFNSKAKKKKSADHKPNTPKNTPKPPQGPGV